MSLNVYLKDPNKKERCFYCGHEMEELKVIYNANITHNLWKMADEAEIYMYLWRPEELGIDEAEDLVGPLEGGLKKLKERPEYYETFNAPNGWGLYVNFVPFVEKYLEACKKNPKALVVVSR